MKLLLVPLIAFFGSLASAAPAILWDCHDAFEPNLVHVAITMDNGIITATVSAKLSSGSTTDDAYTVRDESAMNVIRYVDTKTSGENFVLRGGVRPPVTLSVQALTKDYQVVQSTMRCQHP